MTDEQGRTSDRPRRGLGLVPPPPGLAYLDRRAGEFWSFLDDLITTTEGTRTDGARLGSSWDVEGDPRGLLLAELWAYTAETVAAYTELTASEAYLATASDWTDLRRLAGLVGYRPHPPVAAQGWVQVDIDKGAAPVVAAGTRVQASAAPPDRPTAEVFEAATTTHLREEWAGLTATWIPEPAAPTGPRMRFLGDPGLGAGDRVLFVLEENPAPLPPVFDWFAFWTWLVALYFLADPPAATPRAVTRVVDRRAELGTTMVSFDRDLDDILAGVDKPYAAYRVTATAGSARRLSKVLKVPGFSDAASPVPAALAGPNTYAHGSATTAKSVVLDAALDDLSAHQRVAVVDWSSASPACDVVAVKAHAPVEWEVAPGSPTRVSQLLFATEVPTLKRGVPVTVYVLGPRVAARHYTFPPAPLAPQLRLFPAPGRVPAQVAVRTSKGLEVLACTAAAAQETPPQPGLPSLPRGLIVDLPDGLPGGTLDRAPASANLVRVRHGGTRAAVLGSGDPGVADERLAVRDAPVASDLDPAGNPVSSMAVRVEGVLWDEVPTLYGAGPDDEAYTTRSAADGGVTLQFGDGSRGRRPPSGRDNVTAVYRVGGGSAGEVPAGAIDSLLGSVRGVKKVTGAGPTSGAADQDDGRQLRTLVPGRARAFGRAVSEEDLVDLALGYPGVTHATAWRGAGPTGCACGGAGLHLAFLRRAAGSPRPPLPPEVASLSAYLDSRRDATVPLCVCAGATSTLGLAAVLVVDPRRDANAVVGVAVTALGDPDGALAAVARRMGQPVDRSDVLAVLHAVAGVVGVTGLTVTGGTVGGDPSLGRRIAARFELLMLPADPHLSAVIP